MSSTIRPSAADAPEVVTERSDRTRAVGALVAGYAVAGFGLAVAATVLFPLDARLAVPFSLGGLDSRLVGLALWVGVCLVTSSRGSHEDGRVAATLGLGPVVAAAALGGPAAAAWVAMLGDTEIRELWSRAGTMDSLPTEEEMQTLLEESGTAAMGFWSLEESDSGGYTIYYSVKVPVYLNDSDLAALLEYTASSADQKEEELFSADDE